MSASARPHLTEQPVFETCEPRLLLGGTWLPPVTLEYGYSGQYCDVALEDSDYVRMAYYDPSPAVPQWDADLVYRGGSRNGGGWGWASARLLLTGDEGQWPSIALDSNNHSHISYHDADGGDLRYVVRSGSWSTAQLVDSTGDVGEYSQIALDGGENPHIVYYDRSNAQLKYAYYDGSWHTEAIASVGTVYESAGAPYVYRLASLALDGSDHPHVSFYDHNSGDLMYAVRNGTWAVQTVESDGVVGVDSALALDGAGRPHIAYFDYTDTDLHYAVLNGTWDIQTLNDTADYVGANADMVLDAAGYPHISFKHQTANALGYAYFDGADWHLSVIDSEAYTGKHTSLAMNSSGDVAITYRKHLYYDRQLKMIYGEGFGSTPAVDLAVSVWSVALPGQQWLPGDKVTVPVTVSSVGVLDAVGPVEVSLLASEDDAIGNDFFIDSQAATLNLAPGQTAAFTFSFTIPPDAQPGEYYMVAELNADPGVGDLNLSNNQDISDDPVEVAWKFGDFDPNRKTVKLTVMGQDLGQGDVPVTFTLTGGGDAEILGGDEFTEVRVRNTTEKSTLKISTAGGMWTSVGDIVVEGPLKALDAKTTDLRGSLLMEGITTKILLGDVDGGHQIVINGGGALPDPKAQLSITLDYVSDLVLDTNQVPVKSLTVSEWSGGGDVLAPSIAKLMAKGNSKRGFEGHFEANLHLDGWGDPKATLGAVKIADDVSNVEWVISGEVGAVAIGGELSWSSIQINSGLKSFKADRYAHSEFSVDGAVGSFAVGEIDDADLYADSVKSLKTGRFYNGRLGLTGNDVPAGKPVLSSAKVGDLINAAPDRGWVIQGDVGNIAAGDLDEWLFEADGAVKGFKAGQVTNTQMQVAGELKTLAVKSWASGAVEADSINSLKTSGDRKAGDPGNFLADLELNGAAVTPGKTTLGNANIAGDIGLNAPITVQWDIHGDAKAITAKGDAWNWRLALHSSIKSLKLGVARGVEIRVDDAIGSIQAKEWAGGLLEADSVKSFKLSGDRKADLAGDLIGVNVTLHGLNVEPGKDALGSLTMAGWAVGCQIGIDGNVKAITATALVDTELLIGCDGLNGALGDFTAQCTLKSLSLKGDLPDDPADPITYFDNSQLGAYEIAALKFGKAPTVGSGTIQYHLLGKLSNEPLLGAANQIEFIEV